jgi:hypothetical protein
MAHHCPIQASRPGNLLSQHCHLPAHLPTTILLHHSPSASPHQPDPAHLTFPLSHCPLLVPSTSNTREQCAEAPAGRRRTTASVGVQHAVSTHPVSLSRVRSSSRLASSPLVSAPPASSPLVSTPVGPDASVWPTPGGGLGDQASAAGTRYHRNRSRSWWAAVRGHGSRLRRQVAAPAAWLPSGAGWRPRWVVVAEADVRMGGPGGASGRAGGDGRAAPARPGLAASAPGSLPTAL